MAELAMTLIEQAQWAGRPDLSSESFWTLPIEGRTEAFARLREREPVAFFPEVGSFGLAPGPGYWALTRLDDCLQVGRQWALQKRLASEESVSLELFKPALRLAKHRDLVSAGAPELAKRRDEFLEELRRTEHLVHTIADFARRDRP